MNSITVGLFGTCGKSTWRERYIPVFVSKGVSFYNPQVDNWFPELSKVEAEHLATDKIILFPVLSETYGIGSLSELGFSILNAIRLDSTRNFVILIDNLLDANLVDKQLAEESLRLRALVKSHLKRLRLPNVYLVDTLDEMLEVSLVLYESEKLKESVAKYSLSSKAQGEHV